MNVKIFSSFIFLLISFYSKNIYAQYFNNGYSSGNNIGEFSISVGTLNFHKEKWKQRAFYSLEVVERSDEYGLGLSIGWANIDSHTFVDNNTKYRESLDFYPIELNGKKYLKYEQLEASIGAGISMNFLNYNLYNFNMDRHLESKNAVLFGAQGIGEIRMLFPSTAGRNAFAGFEVRYQWVDRANTILEKKDLTNYRIFIKLGGIF